MILSATGPKDKCQQMNTDGEQGGRQCIVQHIEMSHNCPHSSDLWCRRGLSLSPSQWLSAA